MGTYIPRSTFHQDSVHNTSVNAVMNFQCQMHFTEPWHAVDIIAPALLCE